MVVARLKAIRTQTRETSDTNCRFVFHYATAVETPILVGFGVVGRLV